MQYVAIDSDDETVYFDQAAEPVALEALVQARIITQALTSRPNLCRAELAGAGDGHTFVCQTSFCEEVANSIEGEYLFFYMASDAEHLALARAEAIVSFAPGDDQIDEILAGASKGTRFMGVVVGGQRVGG